MNQPYRPPTFDRFGDKIIMRVSFANPNTVDTYVVDITRLIEQTQDENLIKIVNRLLNS